MLQNARVTNLTVPELLRKNQLRVRVKRIKLLIGLRSNPSEGFLLLKTVFLKLLESFRKANHDGQ